MYLLGCLWGAIPAGAQRVVAVVLTVFSLVGVTGSGKGMTEVKMPGKHKFDASEEREP